MAKKPKKYTMPTAAEVYQTIRQTWSRNPVTKVKGNVKKANSKTACRKSKGKKD